ncbi:MAG: hypothetical protein ACTS68_02225 [Candidatus Hodgkinia cicadicola]
MDAVTVYGDKAVKAFNERWGTSPSKTFRRVFGGKLPTKQLTDGDIGTLISSNESMKRPPIITSRSFRREITSKVRTAYDSSLDWLRLPPVGFAYLS